MLAEQKDLFGDIIQFEEQRLEFDQVRTDACDKLQKTIDEVKERNADLIDTEEVQMEEEGTAGKENRSNQASPPPGKKDKALRKEEQKVDQMK